MANDKRKLTQQQEHLLDGLEKHPELMKRFQSILDLTVNVQEHGQIRTFPELPGRSKMLKQWCRQEHLEPMVIGISIG